MSQVPGQRVGRKFFAAGATLLATLGILLAEGTEGSAYVGENTPHASQGKANRYIGASKCKNCHSSKKSGNQYEVWKKSKHATAHGTLASEKAAEYAKERNIEDPQKSDDCLKCHVTAFGEPKKSIKRGFDATDGVQCETCHGPGENHFKARFAAAAGGEQKEYSQIEEGEIIVTPSVDTCLACHNEESPAYKPFCFHEYREKLRHLNPVKPRTQAEKDALDDCTCDSECVCVKEGRCSK